MRFFPDSCYAILLSVRLDIQVLSAVSIDSRRIPLWLLPASKLTTFAKRRKLPNLFLPLPQTLFVYHVCSQPPLRRLC
jgi:hypothetical protein